MLKVLRKALPVMFAGLFLATNAYAVSKKKNENPVERYALITAVSSQKGVNDYWRGATRVYEELLKMGFKEDDMYFLYTNGKPPIYEPTEIGKKVKEAEFNGSYDNSATYYGLTKIIKRLSKRIDDNDVFFFYIVTHGINPAGIKVYKEIELAPRHINSMFKKLDYKTSVLIFNSCYSGSLLEKIGSERDIVISATQKDTATWIDERYTFGATFLEEVNNKSNDADKDGKVSVIEAFIVAEEKAIEYGRRETPKIKKKYLRGYLSKLPFSFDPEIRIGKDVPDNFSLFSD